MIDGHLLCECKIRTTGAGDSTLHRFLFCDLYARFPFYSASALLAMQTSVLARPFLSVRLSFRHIAVFCPDE